MRKKFYYIRIRVIIIWSFGVIFLICVSPGEILCVVFNVFFNSFLMILLMAALMFSICFCFFQGMCHFPMNYVIFFCSRIFSLKIPCRNNVFTLEKSEVLTLYLMFVLMWKNGDILFLVMLV